MFQEGQYGCGWTFIQFFGPNEPEAVQHRDVYRGSPRNLLFFEQVCISLANVVTFLDRKENARVQHDLRMNTALQFLPSRHDSKDYKTQQ